MFLPTSTIEQDESQRANCADGVVASTEPPRNSPPLAMATVVEVRILNTVGLDN